ncbi:putative SNARE associated protein [Candidatus Zixiibacteriota bacterium]|nr:putative SNARE associated protein [candidate division Zixibacteria bacterium]
MDHSLHLISEFLDRIFVLGPFWIYLTLFLAAFIENIFPPFPGDFFTLGGGALAASGRLNIGLVFLCIYLGGLVSFALVYQFGFSYGREFFIKKNYRWFSHRDILRLEQWFQKRGGWLLIFNRFIVGARTAVALITGISRYNRVKMILLISISFWIFNGLLLFGSYIFVVKFELIAEYFHLYEKIVWPIIVLLAIILAIYKIYRVKQNEEKD